MLVQKTQGVENLKVLELNNDFDEDLNLVD